jgi:hypothetical protein
MRLIRVNNKTNKPVTGTGNTTQATYTDISTFEASLNYPLTLPKNAKLGLLDCVIELPNDYIIVSTRKNVPDEEELVPQFTVSLGDTMPVKSVYLLPARYTIEAFKNMLEWSLNGALEYDGTTDDDFATGFNYSCPTYQFENFNVTKQPILKIQWDRSNPNSAIIGDDLDMGNASFDDETQILLKSSGTDDLYNAYARTKKYFTKGVGIMSAKINIIGGSTKYGFKMGLKTPDYKLTQTNISNSAFFLVVSVRYVSEAYVYETGCYPTVNLTSDEVGYFDPNSDMSVPFYLVSTPLFITTTHDLIPQDGDTVNIISDTFPNTIGDIGGHYRIEVIRGGLKTILRDGIRKPSFLQWNTGQLNGVNVTYSGTTYDLGNMISVKDLVGYWVLSETGSTCEDPEFTEDPFHSIDPTDNTMLNLRDTDIDLTQPILRAIEPCKVSFDFKAMEFNPDNILLWDNLFQFGKSSYNFVNNISGSIVGLKPIDYYRLRFPVNIIIDNIDLESYDTSIKDKENLLFCLNESNLSPFDQEGDLLSVRYTCQNQPLMIALRNKDSIVLNKLKIRLTDNYYNKFLLNSTRESHFNILVSSPKI